MFVNQFVGPVWLVVALAVGNAVGADESAGHNATIETQLKSLLQRDAQQQTDENLRDVLKFYQSGGVVPETMRQRPAWKIISAMIPTDDPLVVAKFVEVWIEQKPMTLSPDTKRLIEANRTDALTAAIRLSQNDFSHTARMAADVLMQYRDRLTAEQWRMILEGRKYVVGLRESYPAGIPARAYINSYSLIPLGYIFLPDREAQTLKTETKVYFDGKQPYPNPQRTKNSGWRADTGYIGFGRLSVGRHTLQLKTTYDFKLGDVAMNGINSSPEYHVEITAADTPDHLVAAVDEKLIALVEAAVVVGSMDEAREFTYSQSVGDGKSRPIAKIVVPAVKVIAPLPVALSMKPEIYVEGDDKPLTRMVWIVPAGKTTTRILENNIGDSRLLKLLQESADRQGRLQAKLVLRPSREDALSDPSIEKYYPRVIERDIEFRWSKIDADKPNDQK